VGERVIALIDYGAGNLTSVKKALATIGADVFVPVRPAELASATGIIVPGVGHFGATRALDAAWVDAILERLGEGRPILGICLGMQWLFEGSDEAPDCTGLGLLGGRCYRLGGVRLQPDTTDVMPMALIPVDLMSDMTGGSPIGVAAETRESGRVRLEPDRPIKIPHVGWNSVAITQDASIIAGVPSGSQMYFTHSYVAPVTSDTVAVTDHGEAFAAVVQHGQVAGVQFHPEKSGDVGLQILRNFVELAG
jgi:glutamine amidotransferase